MPNVAEEKVKSPADDHTPGGMWIQIAFTIDTENFKLLRAYAEGLKTSVPCVVRERVLDLAKELKAASRKSRSSVKKQKREGA